jgi:multidrug efflux system membrane fusion protein
VPVSVAPVVQKSAPVEVHAIGNVEAMQSVAVKSLVGGQIIQVAFHEGEEIRKNQLLFVIDPRPFEAALKQAEAALARDSAQEKYAKSTVDRYRRLVKRGFVTQDQFTQAQANAAALTASVASDRAALEAAKVNLQYTRIYSPIEGKAGPIAIKLGNVVKANDVAIVTINQMHPIAVNFTVQATLLPRIRSESVLEAVVTPQGSRERRRGRVYFINNAIDTTTGTIALKAEYPNEDELLWPGQYVDVMLLLGVQENALLVPTSAVQMGQQGSFVFVVKPDGTVESREVKIDRTLADQSVIAQGLQPNETVVTEGQLRLSPGTKVAVRAPAEQGQQKAGSPPGAQPSKEAQGRRGER